MRVRITPAHDPAKKWRAHLLDTDQTVEFGARGASDYTHHKDPHRMARYLLRHGGVSSDEYHAKLKHASPDDVHARLWTRMRSTRERWDDPSTPGFWSRFLLWRHPDLRVAMAHLPRGLKVIEWRKKSRAARRR